MLVNFDFLSKNGFLKKCSVTSVTNVTSQENQGLHKILERDKPEKCHVTTLEPTPPLKYENVTNVTLKPQKRDKLIIYNQQLNTVCHVCHACHVAKNANYDFYFDLFEERAAIFEFLDEKSRVEAEVKAFDECAERWLKDHPDKTSGQAIEALLSYGLHNPFYK